MQTPNLLSAISNQVGGLGGGVPIHPPGPIAPPVFPPNYPEAGTITLEMACLVNAENWRQQCRAAGFGSCCDNFAADFAARCSAGETVTTVPVETPEHVCNLITSTGLGR